MRGSSTSGLLLLVLGALALTGFLTGNLDRWLAFLFSPERPDIAAPPKKLGTLGAMSMATTP